MYLWEIRENQHAQLMSCLFLFSYLEGTIVHPSPRLQTAPIVEAVVSENNRDVHSSPPVVSCEPTNLLWADLVAWRGSN